QEIIKLIDCVKSHESCISALEKRVNKLEKNEHLIKQNISQLYTIME
ncbi:11350_t:CDS:1, partial [Cetraspora pellucida]